jgi:hypothetical protein
MELFVIFFTYMFVGFAVKVAYQLNLLQWLYWPIYILSDIFSDLKNILK